MGVGHRGQLWKGLVLFMAYIGAIAFAWVTEQRPWPIVDLAEIEGQESDSRDEIHTRRGLLLVVLTLCSWLLVVG